MRLTPRTCRFVLSVLLVAGGLCAAPARAEPPYVDRPLTEILEELEEAGLRLVYTSQLVRPELRVREEPEGETPREVLDAILAPHGLRADERGDGLLVIVPGEPGTAPEGSGEAGVERVAMPFIEDEIVVRPARVSLITETPERPVLLDSQDIESLPTLGRDVFRALSLLPGTTSNDVSAEFHIHGGRPDEVQILLDGQELYEAYHLKDFDNALSSVTSQSLSRVSLTTGAFPASLGDRMGGILDMRTRAAGAERRTQLSLSLVDALALSSGRLGKGDETGDGGVGWMASARRGFVDLSSRALGDEDPVFWDVFGKLEGRLSDRHHLRGNALKAGDQLEFFRTLVDQDEAFDTDYDAGYLWLTEQALLGQRNLLETLVSRSDVARDRVAGEADDEDAVDVTDRRELAVWNLGLDGERLVGRHVLRAGVSGRSYDADYDYAASIEREGPELVLEGPLAERVEPLTSVSTTVDRFEGEFTGEHLGAYLTGRLAATRRLTVELGVRGDRHTLTDETLVSPRLSLAYRAGDRHVLRAAWGRFTQSHRPYEIHVQDGETALTDAERSEHWVLGYEGLVDPDPEAWVQVVRAEVYGRTVKNPRPRFENLFETLSIFPEVEADRVRIDPDRGRAAGIELTLRGALGARTDWWANLARAEAYDEVGAFEVPRPTDQSFAANLSVDHRFGPRWSVGAAWRFHSGWPTTPVALRFVQEMEMGDPEGGVGGEGEADEGGEGDEGEGGELVPQLVLGRVYGARLADYHRLDVRVSRDWPVRWGRLTLFLDVQNLTNRDNPSGFDLELDDIEGPDGEEVEVLSVDEEYWPGILPSIGVSLEF